MSEQISVLVQMDESGQIINVKLPGRGRTPKDFVRTTMSQEEFDRYSGSQTVKVDATKPKKGGKKRGRKAKAKEEGPLNVESATNTDDDDIFEDPEPEPSLDDFSDVKTSAAKKKSLWSTLLKGMHYLTRKTLGKQGEIVEVIAVSIVSHLEDVNDYLKFNQTLSKIVANLETGDIHVYKMDDKADVPDLIITGAIVEPTTVTKTLMVNISKTYNTSTGELTNETQAPMPSTQGVLYSDNLGGPLEPYYVLKYKLRDA